MRRCETAEPAAGVHARPMTEPQTGPAGPSRTAESADQVSDVPEDDPADLAGAGAAEAAGRMHAEVDAIADRADTDAPGHGA